MVLARDPRCSSGAAGTGETAVRKTMQQMLDREDFSFRRAHYSQRQEVAHAAQTSLGVKRMVRTCRNRVFWQQILPFGLLSEGTPLHLPNADFELLKSEGVSATP
jgi:hypothetical protein